MTIIHSIPKRLVSGGFQSLTGSLVLSLATLTANALLTRILPPDSVGSYFLISSIVTTCSMLSLLGVHQAVVRSLAGGDKQHSKAAINSGFLIVLAGSMLVGIPYSLGIGQWLGNHVFGVPVVANSAYFISLWVAGFAIQKLVSQIFRGLHRIGYASVFDGASTAVIFVIALSYIWLTDRQIQLQDVLVITLSALILSIAWGSLLLARQYFDLPTANHLNIGAMLRISMPLFVASAAVLGITEAHIWILASTRGSDEVAVYGAAYRLAKFVVFPLVIINNVIAPTVAELSARKDTNLLERILRATATISGLPAIAMLILVALGGDVILSSLFGGFYAKGNIALLILVAGQAINALTGSPGVLLMMSDHQSIVMKYSIAGGTVGIVTSALLVQNFGYLGVAIGVAVGLSAHNIGMSLYCKRRLGITTYMGIDGIVDTLNVIYRFMLSRINRQK